MQTKHLSPEQHSALLSLAQSSPQDGVLLLFAVLAVTGMRADELAKLTLRDLDQQSGALIIQGSKRSNNRSLSLPQWLLDALLKHHACPKTATNSLMGLLSTNFQRIETPRHAHNAKQCLREHWRQVRLKINAKDLGLHCLRHSVAMRMLEKTDNIRKVQAVLGHKNINNTIKYLDYVNSLEASKDLLGIFSENEKEKGVA
jgi:integrase